MNMLAEKSVNCVRMSFVEDIQRSIERLSECCLNEEFPLSIVLHCMQGRPPSFYNSLCEKHKARILNGLAQPSFGERVVGFLAGQPALIAVDSPKDVFEIFQKISEQAMAGIYILSKKDDETFLENLPRSYSEIEKRISKLPFHVAYVVDEGSADDAGKVVEIVDLGLECKKQYFDALRLE